MTAQALTRRRTLALAWPIVLAQAATAMTGVVDTAVMGRFGTAADLASVGIASVTFSFLYWAFGFLRMSTTGLTAQAEGAGDLAGSRAILVRALGLGGSLGLLILLTFPLTRQVALTAFDASPAVETLAETYFDARIWGAPAALMGYAVTGWLLGRGQTRLLLAFQLVLNGLNAALDAAFVAWFDWGPAGIGSGTALAEWSALAFGLLVVRRGLRQTGPVFDRAGLIALFSANRDIMIRTLALLFCFAWFANAGAQVGTAALAGNQVLLQFVAVSAFVLDSFAFVAEKEAGEAFGRREPARPRRAARITSELAASASVLFTLAFLFGGQGIIQTWVSDPDARGAALAFLPYCAAVPVLGVAAWQLDGLFLGTTQGRALRNAALISTTLYVASDLVLRPALGNHGVWIAFLGMYLFRAGALAAHWPRLMASAAGAPSPPRPQPS